MVDSAVEASVVVVKWTSGLVVNMAVVVVAFVASGASVVGLVASDG